jgi:hypothetical protein
VHIPPTACFLVAALAAFALAFAHGVNGQHTFVSPLRRERLFATWPWGDEDMTWRIFATTWHLGTAVFACSGIALLLLAVGVLEGNAWPYFVAALHAALLALSVCFLWPRLLQVIRRPYAIMVVTCLVSVCVGSWLGTR